MLSPHACVLCVLCVLGIGIVSSTLGSDKPYSIAAFAHIR